MRVAGILVMAAVWVAGSSLPALAHEEALPDVERRAVEEQSFLGRTDGLLTGPSARAPRAIVLDYVRSHHGVFGLDEADIANLKLVARSVSPDGIVHLRFNQVLDGILSFDSGIDGHVTADGRLINVSGAPVPGARLDGTDPALGPRAGLREARNAVDGDAGLPAATEVEATPERTTSFAGGERAVLRWSAGATGPRLAWSVIAEGEDSTYEVLVDAESGELLRRQDLASHLGKARYFGADPMQTPSPIEITMPPEWYDQHAGGTRLWGQYSRTYVDPEDEDPEPGEEESGATVQIPASNGAPAEPDWLYTQSTDFPGASPCPSSGCTWQAPLRETAEVNQFQAGTNAHVLASRFHDHLEAAPIGFDEAAGNFQRTNSSGSGLGGDYVRLEVNDGQDLNNANFYTPPDGIPPRMQMYLYSRRAVNGSDIADIVYHEYAHGLSNRLVVNASGSSALSGFQSRMMGEGWSDFYAVDLLVHEGHMKDTAAPGELRKGYYIYSPAGTRNKPIDCPVDAAGKTSACNESADYAPVSGGYTYGDIVAMYRSLTTPPYAPLYNESPHEGGELWGQTLWDIRTALGREAALALITGGMRLSVDAPSMLDMRDAILQQAVAMRSAPGAPDDHVDALWAVFAKRGMGADATTRSAGSTTPSEGFGLLRAAGPPAFADPYPGGDNDGVIEPGEQFEISQPLRAVTAAEQADLKGTLSAGSGGAVLGGTARWPALGGERVGANEEPLIARLGPGCTQSVPFTLSVASAAGPSKLRLDVDKRPGAAPVELADASGAEPGVTTSSYEATGSGNVADVDLRIGSLRHSWMAQLRVELIHDGVTATIFDRFSFSGQEMVDLVFDSDSTMPMGPSLGAGTMTGRRQPETPNALDAFDGRPVAGTWTLRVTDFQEGFAGVLDGWGVASPQQSCAGRLEIPAAQSGAAGAVGERTATLNGSVTPNGRSTGMRFAFGASAAYGETSPVTSAGAGDDPVGLSHELSGLQPGTTYHYRVETIREGGQLAVAGPDRTFTTAGPVGPPVADPPPAGQPPAVKPPADRAAPSIGAAKVALAAADKRTKRRRASFSLSLSEPGRVTAVVTRAAPGIRSGKRCVAPPKTRPRGARSCVRQAPAARGTLALPAPGRGTLRLPGPGLAKGSYVATLTARDAAGNASRPLVVRFRVR